MIKPKELHGEKALPGHLANGALNLKSSKERAKRSKKTGRSTIALRETPAPVLNWTAPKK